MFGLLHQLILFLLFIYGHSSNGSGANFHQQGDKVFFETNDDNSDTPGRLPYSGSLKFETEETNGEWIEKIDFQSSKNNVLNKSILFLHNIIDVSQRTYFSKSSGILILKKLFLRFRSLLI